MKLPGVDRLGSLGFVGERKALALLCLGFYSTLFFLVGLSARTELPEWVPVFFGMMAIYVTAFVAVAAEWFWGRWFAVGLGYWGMTMTVMAFVSTRMLPPANSRSLASARFADSEIPNRSAAHWNLSASSRRTSSYLGIITLTTPAKCAGSHISFK